MPRTAWNAVRERVVGPVRMCGNRVPQEHLVLDSELSEHAMDDRRRGLSPAPGPERGPLVRLPPCVEGAFARERDSGPAHASKAWGLAEGDDLGASARVEVVEKVRAALRCSALGVVASNFVAEEVERPADGAFGEVGDQPVEAVHVMNY